MGLGSRSTLFYLKQLNELYQIKMGGYSTCPLLMLNTNFNEINPLLPKPSAALSAVLQQYAEVIERLNVEHLLIPNITLHETTDRLVFKANVIHPVYLTASHIALNGWSEVVLFGSAHTMQADYIGAFFSARGIKTNIPSLEDRLLIDEVRKQVYSETETEELIEKFHILIKKYCKHRPVVLACTELSIVKPKEDNYHLLDMAQEQITAAISSLI